jgi:hypothetical protein
VEIVQYGTCLEAAMVNLHTALFFVAFILFILAGCPTGLRVRLEWFAFALLTLAYII